MNDLTKNLLLWVVVAIVLMVVFQSFSPRDGAASATVGESASYTRFLQDVDAGKIRSVVITDESTFTANTIRYKRTDGTEGQVVGPNDPKLMDQLFTRNVDVVREKPRTGPGFWGIVLNFLPVLLIIGFWLFIMRQMQGGGGGAKGAMSFG
jgi:cell division protease FtsH